MSLQKTNVKRELYQVLEVSPLSPFDDIHKNYRALSKKYHPDLATDKVLAEEKMKEIVAAYNQLKEPESRKLYDSQRIFRVRNFRKKRSHYQEPKLGFFAKLFTPKNKQPKIMKGMGGKDPVDSVFSIAVPFALTRKPDSVALALNEFESLIDVDPKNPDLFYNLGVCSYFLGKYDDAIIYFKKVQQLDPEDMDAKIIEELLSIKETPMPEPEPEQAKPSEEQTQTPGPAAAENPVSEGSPEAK